MTLPDTELDSKKMLQHKHKQILYIAQGTKSNCSKKKISKEKFL